MRIGFDIDDCITKTTQTFCGFSNILFNNNLNYKLLTSPSAKFEDTGLINYNQVKKIKETYLSKIIFRTIAPYPDAVKTLINLQHSTIYFITTRDDYKKDFLLDDTEYWFRSRGINNFEILITNNKPTIINKLHLDIFIEDNILQVKKIQEKSNVRIIVPKRPWNWEYRNVIKDVQFVKSWSEINLLINRYDKENRNN